MKVLIVGGGKVGSDLAALLLASQHEVILIEERADVVTRLQKEFAPGIVHRGSGTDPRPR